MWYTVKGFCVVSEAEVDVFLEFSCFFYDPMDVGNLISGSSALFKLYAEYIMQNARLDEAQAGIKVARRNINKLNMVMKSLLWKKAKKN